MAGIILVGDEENPHFRLCTANSGAIMSASAGCLPVGGVFPVSTDASQANQPGSLRDGSQTPAEHLALVYDELRAQAAAFLDRERVGHTLQATALVHEAYVKLVKNGAMHFRDSAHFRAVAAQSMRQILVDHARARNASVRQGNRLRLTLADQTPLMAATDGVDVLSLHESINDLSRLDSRKAQVVELRFFGGLTCTEVAEVLSVSIKTVEADWSMARAWLRARLTPRGDA